MKIIRNLFLVFIILIFTGCASLFMEKDSYSQRISIKTNPSGAAIFVDGIPEYENDRLKAPSGGAILKTSERMRRTPNIISLTKNKGPYIIRLEKEGYQSVEIEVSEKFNNMALLNTVNFIAWDIDSQMGFTKVFKPRKIKIKLEKIEVE